MLKLNTEPGDEQWEPVPVFHCFGWRWAFNSPMIRRWSVFRSVAKFRYVGNSDRHTIPDETAVVGMVDKVRARSKPSTSLSIEMGSGPVPEELLGSVIAYFNPRRVILFGSRARGEADTDSDLDLLVILDDDARPELLSWRAGYEARKAYHRATDIVPCRESVFRDRARVVGSLAYTADTEGLVVYERD